MTVRNGSVNGLRATSPRPPRSGINRPWALIGLLALVALVLWVVSTRLQDHHLQAVFSSALGISSGLEVQVHGRYVGKVSSARLEDGMAVIGLGIEDDNVWPLRQGTTAKIRYGSTVGVGTRIVELNPGPRSAPALPENGIIDVARTTAPVEIDQLFNTFDGDTRKSLRGLAENAGKGLDGQGPRLNRGLDQAARTMEATAGLVSDAAEDEQALAGLVTNLHRVTETLGPRRAEISDLVTVADATFDELAINSNEVRASLDNLPPALTQARTTLASLSGTTRRLDGLLDDVGPGARALPALARAARPALADLRAVVPRALSTLRTARTELPPTTRFLSAGQPFAERLRPIADRTPAMLSCIRPYTPELAGFMSNWTSFLKDYDGEGHYARMRILAGPTSLTSTPPIATDDFLKAAGGTKYALPRPPGLNGGQPWLLPQCGAGRDALDPSKDPEDREQ